MLSAAEQLYCAALSPTTVQVAFFQNPLFQHPLVQNLLAILLGYLIGSIPFAFLFAKWRSGVDLTKTGSRNIGTLNSYEVTGSKLVGGLTLLADVLKGWLPLYLTALVWDAALVIPMGVALVFGHCFPIWLRFKGGRGLATAAGTTLAINPVLLKLWLVGYFLGLLIKKQVHVGAAIATIFTAILLVFLPDSALEALNMMNLPVRDIRIGAWLMLLVILIRHIEPLLELRKSMLEKKQPA